MKAIKLQNQLKNEKKMSLKSFHIVGMIAEGSYSEVYEAVQLKNNRKVAIKKVYKESITQSNKHAEIYVERYMMKNYSQKHPSLIEFIGSFQDKDFLYFVSEYCPFGDLGLVLLELYQCYKNGHSEEVEKLIKIYIFQITSAILFLHKEGVAHLDVKPKNIVVDNNYNLKLIDFATCCFFEEQKQPPELTEQIRKYQFSNVKSYKRIESEQTNYRSNFVGTPEYVSPEMLNFSRASKEADLWALGCIIYEFYIGKQPFTDISENAIFNNILNLKYSIDQNIPEDAQDLIRQLLQINPSDRLGSIDSEDVIKHPFFKTIVDYIPWESPIPIPNQCKMFYQELMAKQSMQSILWGFQISKDLEVKQEFVKRKPDRLKTIMEELDDGATPMPAGLKQQRSVLHSTPGAFIKTIERTISSPNNADRESMSKNSNSVFKHFDKSVGFIQLNTNRWFCIPQIAILFGYLKPPCLLIDFIKGEKKYLPIDDTMRISTDGVFYVRNQIYKILESASFFYKFKDAEARPINWIQVVRSIKKEYLGQ